MRSFTIPVFMNALSTVLLFSLVDNARSVAVAAQPGYLPHHHHHHHHPHQHNHIRPAHININDLKINHQKNGHPSMPSTSSQIFSEKKLEDNVLLVNDAHLKDGWQSSLEVADHNDEAGDGSGSPLLGLADSHGDGNTANTATIKTVVAGPPPPPTQGEERIGDQYSPSYDQDATEYYHTQPRPKMSMTELEPGSADVRHMESGALSRSRASAPGLPHHQACKIVLRKIQSGLVSRLSSYASSIHRGVVRFINFRLSMYGAELRRTESPSGEGEYSIIFEDFIWE